MTDAEIYSDNDGVTHLTIDERPKSDDKAAAAVKAAKAGASEIKNSRFALGKAPENLTENQQVKLAMIQANDSQPYRGRCLKEALFLLQSDQYQWHWQKCTKTA